MLKSVTLRFMFSSFISLLGNASAAVVMPVILLIKTGDPLAAGTLALLCGAPQFIAGIFGGAVLDRFNRRNISILSDVISALCVAALPIVEMTIGLSFEWFLIFGILGAIGDIPGMTARDVLFPSAVKRDGWDMQRFMGIWQSLDSLAVIIGPAMASLLIGFIGTVNTLWATAALSLIAALVTVSIPSDVGKVSRGEGKGFSVRETLKEGYEVIFKTDKVIGFSMVLSAGVAIVAASYQGIILPVYFTDTGRAELLGYVLSMMAAGNIVGPVIYSIFMNRLSRRCWYILSMIGIGAGLGVMGTLPSYPVLLAAACFTGIASGPVSSLLGYLILERMPEEKRGTGMGMQNAFMLILPPVFIFAVSAVISYGGVMMASAVCILLLWCIILYGMFTRNMKDLGDNDDENKKVGYE